MRAADRVKEENQAVSSMQGPQRLLVVEDLEDSRTSMQEMLSLALQVPWTRRRMATAGCNCYPNGPIASLSPICACPKSTA